MDSTTTMEDKEVLPHSSVQMDPNLHLGLKAYKHLKDDRNGIFAVTCFSTCLKRVVHLAVSHWWALLGAHQGACRKQQGRLEQQTDTFENTNGQHCPLRTRDFTTQQVGHCQNAVFECLAVQLNFVSESRHSARVPGCAGAHP